MKTILIFAIFFSWLVLGFGQVDKCGKAIECYEQAITEALRMEEELKESLKQVENLENELQIAKDRIASNQNTIEQLQEKIKVLEKIVCGEEGC